jgi:mannose-6-phosphate isomerase-like protein (cupin superfamily)
MRNTAAAAPVGVAGIFVLLALPALAQQAMPAPTGLAPAAATAPQVQFAWSPKLDTLPAYGSNKPVTRLAEVLAAHRGQAHWRENVVETQRWDAHWIQMAPGEKTRAQFYGDDRTVWVVWGGRIRFSIAGQQPFVASRGFIVQAPARVAYSLETVGDEPSLRFEVTHAGRDPLFPADDGAPPPPDTPGVHYIKISSPTPPAVYSGVNRPYVDFLKDVVAADPTHGPKDGSTVRDDDIYVNIIRGQGVPLPPETNRGHYHLAVDEFWFILEGRMDYLFEGVGLVTADAGDVAFTPPYRWHRASWHEGQMDTRLSFNNRPGLFHNFGEHANARQ